MVPMQTLQMESDRVKPTLPSNGSVRHDPPVNDPFGKRLRAARERRGLSQNHFAHRLNLEADTG